jgi:hypothetical protein
VADQDGSGDCRPGGDLAGCISQQGLRGSPPATEPHATGSPHRVCRWKHCILRTHCRHRHSDHRLMSINPAGRGSEHPRYQPERRAPALAVREASPSPFTGNRTPLRASLLHLRIEIESDSGGVRRWHRDRPSDSHVRPDRQSRRNGADSPACALSGPDDAARLPRGRGSPANATVLRRSSSSTASRH